MYYGREGMGQGMANLNRPDSDPVTRTSSSNPLNFSFFICTTGGCFLPVWVVAG